MPIAASARRPRVPPFVDPPGYGRHRPEATLLYQLVQQHYPAFREPRAQAGRPLPEFLQQEFAAYLKCGRLEGGFLRDRELRRLPKNTAMQRWRSRQRAPYCVGLRERGMSSTVALIALSHDLAEASNALLRTDTRFVPAVPEIACVSK